MSDFSGCSVLVTGGAGFIGSHLVERLVSEGAAVCVIYDFSTGSRENLVPFMDCIDLHEQSITDPAACAAACVGIDYVLHQAALPSVSRSVSNPIATHDVSATGTLNMLVAANDAGVRRLVYAGSSSAYGDTPTIYDVFSSTKTLAEVRQLVASNLWVIPSNVDLAAAEMDTPFLILRMVTATPNSMKK